ncbi:MAG: hypothetical protein AABZ32_04835 [Bacteroidota bacterium]
MNTIHLQVNLSFQQLIDTVKQLSPNEKIKINEAIWDESMPIPEEHKMLVLDRMKKAKKNPERLMGTSKNLF